LHLCANEESDLFVGFLELVDPVLQQYLASASHRCSASEVYEASTQAWSAVNARIALGRGSEFQIGHGVLMGGSIGSSTSDALRDTAESWTLIRAHIDEVFFGDVRGAAAVLNASSGVAGHPFRLVDSSFADEPRYDLEGPSVVTPDQIYSLLRAIVG
jgi:5-methylcytosine-specific restriction protein B